MTGKHLYYNGGKKFFYWEVIGLYVEETIKRLLAKYSEIGLEKDSVRNEDPLCELGLNSLSFIQMVVEIEQEFQIEFEMEMLGMDSFEKAENIISYVEALIQCNNREDMNEKEAH